MIRFLKALWSWLMEKWVFWLMVAVVFAAALVAFWPAITESRVRITGWALELFGLGTVAWGIRETRRQFEWPGIFENFLEWWARRPKLRMQPVTGAGALHASGGARVSGSGSVSHGTPRNPTLEDRIVALEANLRGVNECVDRVQRELHNEVVARDEAVSSERRTREKEDTKIKQKLESVETGGLSVSMMGVVWLAVGLTFSTIPNELVSIFK